MFRPVVIRHRSFVSILSPMPSTSLRQHRRANGRSFRLVTIRRATFGSISFGQHLVALKLMSLRSSYFRRFAKLQQTRLYGNLNTFPGGSSQY